MADDMDRVYKYFRKDALAGHLGMELVEARPGWARARMPIRDCLRNGYGYVHGGAIFALADFAFAAAANAHGTVALAMNATISFTKPGIEGDLTAEAEEIALGRRTGTYRVTVRDEDGDTVAAFQGGVFRLGEELPVDETPTHSRRAK